MIGKILSKFSTKTYLGSTHGCKKCGYNCYYLIEEVINSLQMLSCKEIYKKNKR